MEDKREEGIGEGMRPGGVAGAWPARPQWCGRGYGRGRGQSGRVYRKGLTPQRKAEAAAESHDRSNMAAAP